MFMNRLFGALLGGVLFMLGCRPASQSAGAGSPASTSPASAVSARTINVEVVRLEPGPFEVLLRLVGTATAYHDLRLAAEEGGRVAQVYADKGRYVRAGEPIMKIDDTLLRAALQEARAAYELARETYERQRRLWEEDSIGTELQYLQARYNYAAALSKLQTLEARLEKAVIRAPVSGVVERLFVREGEMAAPGAPVVRLLQIDRIRVVAGVPEQWAERIRTGMPVELRFDVLPGRTFQGRIAYVGAALDGQNRTLPIEMELSNPRGLIKPEMVAELHLLLERLPRVLAIPKAVLNRTENGFQVFVAVPQPDGSYRAEARLVELGPENEGNVVVQRGLQPGELLIKTGFERLNPNDPVRILNLARPVSTQ
jgi:membrane fusion protein (multidrug efflux system)